MESFNEIIDRVMECWKLQKEKANLANKLMDEAEELEKIMYDLLHDAKEIDEEAYQEFLESFTPQESEGFTS